MSIDPHPGQKPLAPPPQPSWGETTAEDDTATVVRFVLADRVVTFPAEKLERWEHVTGELEVLTIKVGKEQVVVEGNELAAVRAALDLGRLCELRSNYARAGARPGPRVQRIAIEAA